MIPTTKAKQRVVLDELIAESASILRRLRVLRAQLHNRAAKRGRRSSPPTRRVVVRVFRLWAQRPRPSMQQIAMRCNVSVGRVSEIVRGKRT